MNHDHNFKNLILDYPHQAIDFFAAVEAQAIGGLVTLEPSPEQRLKYVDFIDIYADLDDNERQRYTQLYPQEVTTMAGFAQRFTDKGREEGRQEGRQEGHKEGRQEGHKEGHKEGLQRGEARILTAQLRLRFGDLPADIHQRIEVADADTLLRWSERVLTAATLDEILAD
ncbi:MAG: transposase [Chromatiaceae bacterium]|nr:transposase [Chromatiaceae bacterium]